MGPIDEMTKLPPCVGPINETNQETAVRGVNQQNGTGRAHSAGYPIGRSHSAGYSRVEVAYRAGNPRSIDKKHESIRKDPY